MGFFDIFKKKKRNLYDEIKENTVKIFRDIAKSNNIEQINSISDEKIMNITQEVMNAFKSAAEEKAEKIPGGYLLTIAMKFVIVYATTGEKFYNEHLTYEIDKYINDGLRDDYKHNLLN
jgi:aromatic ring hydroxylase